MSIRLDNKQLDGHSDNYVKMKWNFQCNNKVRYYFMVTIKLLIQCLAASIITNKFNQLAP